MLVESEEIIERAAQTASDNARRHETARNPFVTLHRIPALTEEQVNQRNHEIEQRRWMQRRLDLWRASGVPVRYQDAKLEELSRVPTDAAEKYSGVVGKLAKLLTEPAIIVLLGNRGTGKTHLACATVREACRCCISAKYAHTGDYLASIKATYDDSATSSELSVEETYARVGMLVLDEFQERGNTEWEATKITRLIDRRYSANRATIIIANLLPKDFATNAGTSIVSRIKEDGGVIECKWTDLRGRIERDTAPLAAETTRVDQ